MWGSVSLFGLFLLSMSAECAQTKVGDEVVLAPGPPSMTGPITSIVWKHGNDLAVDWDGSEVSAYRQFKERGFLNVSTGALTITGVTLQDAGEYGATINNQIKSPTFLKVFKPVTKPTISKLCNTDETCVLTCDGDTTDANEVTYSWWMGGILLEIKHKSYEITKESSSETGDITCELANPVSKERSGSITHPFAPFPSKVITGVSVFVCLILVVLAVIVIHRLMSGMWFHQQQFMPWEPDFWKKQQMAGKAVRGEEAGEEVAMRT